MKRIYYLLLIFMTACQSKPIENTSERIDSVLEVESDTIGVYYKSISQTVSQKDKLLMESVALSNEFYKNLREQNYPAATKQLHPDALSATSFDEWLKIYKLAQEKKGRLAFVKMVAHGAKCKMKGGNGEGDYAELIFDSQYKDGNMREKLTFYRKDSTESAKILGYEYHEILEKVGLDKILEE